MNETSNPLAIILLINSVIIIGLILNQNESKNESASTQTSSVVNPLELITWGCVSIQLVLLLINLKVVN